MKSTSHQASKRIDESICTWKSDTTKQKYEIKKENRKLNRKLKKRYLSTNTCLLLIRIEFTPMWIHCWQSLESIIPNGSQQRAIQL